MALYYTLDGHTPVPEPDMLTWAWWFDRTDRQIAQDWIDGARISTVFLGLDHNFSLNPEAGPILFETMIFGGPLDQAQWRYITWDEALDGHDQACSAAREAAVLA